VHGVGEVGRVNDEAVLEGKDLVWRAHDGVTGASVNDWYYRGVGAYFMPERGAGLRSKDRFSNSDWVGSL
jgi:hypothetical protein